MRLERIMEQGNCCLKMVEGKRLGAPSMTNVIRALAQGLNPLAPVLPYFHRQIRSVVQVYERLMLSKIFILP